MKQDWHKYNSTGANSPGINFYRTDMDMDNEFEIGTAPEVEEDVVEEAEPDTEEHKEKKGFKKRIERFQRRLSEKEAEIEYWKNQVPKTEQPSDGKPKLDQFHDPEQYAEALSDWKLEQKQQEQAARQLADKYREKESVIREVDPEYDDLIDDFKDKYKHVNAPEINQFIADSDIGPDIFYHLAKNHELVDKILKLPAHKRLGELGKIEAKLEKPEKVEPNRVSKAPTPVSKTSGQAVSTRSIDDPDLSQSEYRRLRAKMRK